MSNLREKALHAQRNQILIPVPWSIHGQQSADPFLRDTNSIQTASEVAIKAKEVNEFIFNQILAAGTKWKNPI